MSHQHRGRQLRAPLAACALGLVVIAVVPSEGGDAGGSCSSVEAPERAAPDQASTSGPGMRAYVGPDTGELTAEPPPAEARGRATDEGATSMSQTGLFEQSAPGGGVMVDLQGRFMNEMRATITPEGEMHTDCIDLPVVGPSAN